MGIARSPAGPALLALSASALLAGALLLGGGGGSEPGGPVADGTEVPMADDVARSTPAADVADQAPVSASTPAVSAELLAAPAVQAAVAMAARDAGVDHEEVAVTDVREMTWPSSALGCPQPDMMYLEVLTPGYRVMTFAAGARRLYHTNAGGRDSAIVVPCSPEVSKQGGLDAPPPAQLEAIRADAASRAGSPETPVELVRVAPSAATTLTCDEEVQAGGGDADVSLTGELVWEITVRAGALELRYRASGNGFAHCGDLGVDADGNPIE